MVWIRLKTRPGYAARLARREKEVSCTNANCRPPWKPCGWRGSYLVKAYAEFQAIANAPASITTDADRQSQEIILQHILRSLPRRRPVCRGSDGVGARSAQHRRPGCGSSIRSTARVASPRRTANSPSWSASSTTATSASASWPTGHSAGLTYAVQGRRLLAARRRRAEPAALPGDRRRRPDAGHADAEPIAQPAAEVALPDRSATGPRAWNRTRPASSWPWWPAARRTSTSTPTTPSTTGTSVPATSSSPRPAVRSAASAANLCVRPARRLAAARLAGQQRQAARGSGRQDEGLNLSCP